MPAVSWNSSSSGYESVGPSDSSRRELEEAERIQGTASAKLFLVNVICAVVVNSEQIQRQSESTSV
jgi:hypothetical protein